jgi:hypothetical protein
VSRLTEKPLLIYVITAKSKWKVLPRVLALTSLVPAFWSDALSRNSQSHRPQTACLLSLGTQMTDRAVWLLLPNVDLKGKAK